MQFEKDKTHQKLGEKIGFLFSYFLFTTLLFFILRILEKIPKSWNYLHIMGITILIVIIGLLIQSYTGKNEFKSIFSRL